MHLNHIPLLLLGTTSLSTAHSLPSKPTFTELFHYPPSSPIFLENLLPLPDGRLLLSSFTPSLLIFSPSHRDPCPLFTLPNTTAYTGLTPLTQNLYAVSSGLMTTGGFGFQNNTAQIQIFSLAPNSPTASLKKPIPIPNTTLLNGLLSLPTNPHILLLADSILGRILRIDIKTGKVTALLQDPLLAPSDTFPLGINGLASRPGDFESLYFTSSSQGFFGGIKITKQGFVPTGSKVEVLARMKGEIGWSNAFDDLHFESTGKSAYIAWQRSRLLKAY